MSMLDLLLVEDNPDDEVLAIRAMRSRKLPVTVHVARDGEEAVDMLGLSGRGETVVFPALVVLDLKLPKLNGHEVLAMLRADPRTSSLPVLVLSSSSVDTDVERATAMGARYLRKPDDFFDFIEKVGEAVQQLTSSLTSVAGPVRREYLD